MSKGGNKLKVTIKKPEDKIFKSNHSKQIILDLLCQAISATEAEDDVQELVYDDEKEVVYVNFEHAYHGRVINVAMDSGWVMIKDVVNHIDIG